MHGRGETVGAALVEHPGRSGDLVHRIDRDGAASSARPAAGCTSGCRSRWAARTRRSCWTTPISSSRSTACSGARSARPASAAPRRAGSSCSAESTTTSSGCSSIRRGRCELGDGRKKGTDVGPLIHEASRRKVEQYVDIGQAEGADLLCGGRRAGRTRARRTASSSSRRSSRAWSRVAARAGGDLRSGAVGDSRVDAGGGVRREQRREVRPVVVGLHAGRERRVSRACRARQRHHVHQRADDRRRGTPAVRRGKADRATGTAKVAGRSTSSTRRRRSATSISRARCSERRSTITPGARREAVVRARARATVAVGSLANV